MLQTTPLRLGTSEVSHELHESWNVRTAGLEGLLGHDGLREWQ
jgi:hypothetical protein